MLKSFFRKKCQGVSTGTGINSREYAILFYFVSINSHLLFKEIRRVLSVETFQHFDFFPFPRLLSLQNATCNSPPLFFFWVVVLKLLPKCFWPSFALRYAHSTAGEISGLFVCKLEEGIWLHQQHFPSSHRARAQRLFGPALRRPRPRGSQIPRPPQATYQKVCTGEQRRCCTLNMCIIHPVRINLGFWGTIK